MKDIFIVGSKGIPAQYGGFETFVEKLTEKRKSDNIKYHVACLSNNRKEFEYNNAHCFNIKVPNIGAAKAVYYDIAALRYCVRYIEKYKISGSVVYILACRIGPFMRHYVKRLHKMGCKVYVNPDGHEWKRGKWNKAIKCYWKYSEKLMVKHSDLLICDSVNIENYIKKDYAQYNPRTTFIAYGADVLTNTLNDSDKKVRLWYKDKKVKENEYYLVVGRFVPENNYEIMIREFMKSKTNKDFVLITNIEKNKFYEELKKRTKFDKDKRIKFVGTVYDQDLLAYIREHAYGYLHGHEVGGTNPSLLEALATTKLNLLLNVGFNKEVGKDGAIYWGKRCGELSSLLEKADNYSESEIDVMSEKAKNRIYTNYSWEIIVDKYEKVLGETNG